MPSSRKGFRDRNVQGGPGSIDNAVQQPHGSGDGRLRLAIEAAHDGGEVLLGYFGGELQIETKSNAIDLVTVADRAAEKTILARLTEGTPDYAVLAEESGARVGKPGAPRWVVDPLDGTTNFAHGNPHYSVSIGLMEDDVPIIGVVHDPGRGETFYAERGYGAWLLSGGRSRRLAVGDAEVLADSVIATGFAYDRATADNSNVEEFTRVIGKVRGIRRAGGAALDLAWVAAGRLDAYWEYGLAPWDWCAGSVLVRESGGTVVTLDQGDWTIDSPNICVGQPTLVIALLETLLP